MEKLMIRNLTKTFGSFRLAAGVGLPFLMAVSAYAQAPGPAVEATTDRVIVTGSYIPTAETESALPVTVYTAEVLQKQGANTPVEGLRQLPSFVGAAATENDSNGGNGAATINLRGIGPNNVLTLLNGRRAFLGIFRTGGGSDINAIPISAISRVEVLKDGASAIYGSDAVAGVVNFALLDGPGEKPYEGAEMTLLFGNTTDTDAHVRQVAIKGGVVGLDGKVSIAAAGEYYSRANLFSRDRAIATTGDQSNNAGDPGYPNSTGLGLGGANNNSPTFAGRVSLVAPVTLADGRVLGGQLVLINGSDSQARPAAYRSFVTGSDPASFNFRAFTPAIPGMEKANYYVAGRYKVFGDGLQIYGDIMYSKVKQDNGLAGAPFSLTNAANGRTEARASIFNPFGNNLASVRYRFEDELGLRRSFYDKDYYRYVGGLNGDFNLKDNAFISHFGYDTGFLAERYVEQRIDSGDGRRSVIRTQIANNLFNPFVGQFAPKVGTAPTYVNGVPTGLTAPYDNNLGAFNSSYLGHSFFYEKDWLADAKVNMHLFPNLWNGGVDLAAGYEHREIAQHAVPDPVEASGDQLGFNQAPNTKTLQEVDSFFTELAVPLVTSTMDIPFVRSLDFSVAWRYEKFTDKNQYTKLTQSFDNANQDENFGGTPRVSVRYQPVPDVTLRASWGQSFLSPTPTQLFLPVTQNFPVIFDPLNPGGGATVQPPDGVWRGGNPRLLPEKTDSYTAGVVWTPKFLPGFSMTADVYQIFTKDLILGGDAFAQVLTSLNVLDPDGFGNASGVAAAPGGPGLGVTRLPDGTLDAVDSAANNAGKRLVNGLDVTAVYEIPTANWGKFTVSGGWNHFFTWKAEPGAGVGTHSFLGEYNTILPLTPGGIPWNKGFLRGEWDWRGFDFIATGNYVGDYWDDPNFIQGNILVPGNEGTTVHQNFVLHRKVTSYITLDMQLSYEFRKPATEAAPSYAKDAKDGKNPVSAPTEAASSSIWQRMLWGTKVTVGVNDAFDRQPPSVLAAFNDNYDTSNYSIRNRYWYISLSKKF
ncbi:MAG: iron complex outerrane recepter protein [Verrucomicrobiota bacterium]